MLLLILISCEEVKEEQSGAEIYAQYCGICHGENGEGYSAPAANALANPEFLAAATDEFLVIATKDGRPTTKMSPWGDSYGGPLNDEQVTLVVDYIRQWETLPAADVHEMEIIGDINNGTLLYAEYCSSCHGQTGEGTDIALSLNNPVFMQTASDGFIWHALQYGRSNTIMLSYAETLTEQEIYDIVSLIRSWEE